MGGMDRIADPREDLSIERPEVLARAAELLTTEAKSSAMAARVLCEEFGMGTRQAHRYIAHARDEIANAFRDELPSRAAALAEMALETYRDARAWRDPETGKPDSQGRNGAIKNLATIYGIGPKLTPAAADALAALLDAARGDPGNRDDEIARLEAADKAKADGPDAG